MHQLLAGLLLVTSLFVGCIGTGDSDDVLATQATGPNPWETGLADHAKTPSVAEFRSADERRSALSPPGSPAFAPFDAAMEAFMAVHHIPTATFALLKDGKLHYENAYGATDHDATQAADTSTMMRIASISKPITAAVVQMQVQEGLYALDDPVFCVPPSPAEDCRLPIAPHPERPVVDERIEDITVADLIAHEFGLTRPACTEPIWGNGTIAVAEDLGVPSPPAPWRIAQWMMGVELEHAPGTERHYCNVGYMLLGLVAEAASGATMPALYEAYVFGPLEVSGDIERGHTLVADRNAREPFYTCEYGRTNNVYAPDETVCWPDGGFDLPGIVQVGGLVSTAAAVGAIYNVYDNDGTVRDPADGGDVLSTNGHSGGLPGTATVAWRISGGAGLADDVQVVTFFNKAAPVRAAGVYGCAGLFDVGVCPSPYDVVNVFTPLAVAWAAGENAAVDAGVNVVVT